MKPKRRRLTPKQAARLMLLLESCWTVRDDRSVKIYPLTECKNHTPIRNLTVEIESLLHGTTASEADRCTAIKEDSE